MTDDLELRRLAASIRERASRLTDEQMNANLRAAVKGHTPHGDRKQAELASPLTEAELKAGGGWMPAITDVDMTPRPRYRESQAAFEARMASYGADVQALRNETRLRNRAAALRSVETATGALAYFTQCACGWCGLRAVSWMKGEAAPLRNGRLIVAAVRGDGAIELTQNAAASVPAICHGEYGDYVYRVDDQESSDPYEGRTPWPHPSEDA